IVNVTSDAAVEAYEGWGGYGSSKAALAQLSAVLAVERPELRVYVVDPGDMHTQMHQEAFPGEDISDRPPPEAGVPGLLAPVPAPLPAALTARRGDPGQELELRLSTPSPDGSDDRTWFVELRRPVAQGAQPFADAVVGERLTLPDGGSAELLARYAGGKRLWL